MAEADPIITNIWQPFGLRGDPFFQEELRVDPKSAFPAKLLFVGREEQLRRIGRRIGGSDGSRTIVEGAAGVGKTSFLNRLKSELAQSRQYLVHEQPVRITSRSTPDSFLADVLRVLVRIFTAGGGRRDAFWKNVAFLVESRTIGSGGVNVGVVGVEYGQDRVEAEVSHEPLIDAIGEALRRVVRKFKASVILHVNNLENLAVDETEAAGLLIQNVRDVFLQPGAHWLMAGATGIERSIFRQTDQVGGVFPAAEILEPLLPADVARMLELRYKHLRVQKTASVVPVSPDVAASLYGLYHGDLRNFLRLLSDAANLVLGVEGIRPMTREQILSAAGAEYRARIFREIGDLDVGYLRRIVERSGEPGFRVTEVSSWTGVSQGGASKIVDRLQTAGLIRTHRTEGKSVYFHPTGTAAVAFAVIDPPSS